MLKKAVTYVDYDGVTRTEVFHFNLTKIELLELGIEEKRERIDKLQKAFEAAGDNPSTALVREFVEVFEEFIDASYGVRDERRFRKGPEVLAAFKEEAAYAEFVFQMAQNPDLISEFIQNIAPADLVNQALQEQKNTQKAEEAREARKAPVVVEETPTEPDDSIRAAHAAGVDVFALAEKYDLKLSQIRGILATS